MKTGQDKDAESTIQLTSVNGLRFVGRYGGYTDDDVKLTYFWHRWYDSADGRWVSRDPIGVAGGVNLYGYAGNSPVNVVDFWGLAPEGCVNCGPVPVVLPSRFSAEQLCGFGKCQNVLNKCILQALGLTPISLTAWQYEEAGKKIIHEAKKTGGSNKLILRNAGRDYLMRAKFLSWISYLIMAGEIIKCENEFENCRLNIMKHY